MYLVVIVVFVEFCCFAHNFILIQSKEMAWLEHCKYVYDDHSQGHESRDVSCSQSTNACLVIEVNAIAECKTSESHGCEADQIEVLWACKRRVCEKSCAASHAASLFLGRVVTYIDCNCKTGCSEA